MRRSGSSETTECSIGPMPESARRRIGRITLAAKLPGTRRTGDPSAPFEVAGVGDGLTANLHGHEAGNGGYSQGEPKGYRANPRPDRWRGRRHPLNVQRVRLEVPPPSPPRIWTFLSRLRAIRQPACSADSTIPVSHFFARDTYDLHGRASGWDVAATEAADVLNLMGEMSHREVSYETRDDSDAGRARGGGRTRPGQRRDSLPRRSGAH